MPRLFVGDFTTQSINVKGRNVDILTLQIPRGYSKWEIAQKQPPKIFIPLRMDFTVANAGGSAATPTLALDYPVAELSAEDSVGTELYATYSTDGNTFNAATEVTTTPAADGEYQVLSLSSGTIKVYVPASATRYFRFYYRPAAGRLSFVRKPPRLGIDEIVPSVKEFPLATLHRANQLKVYTALRFGQEMTFSGNEFFGFRLFLPDIDASQSTETNITKTVTREALFIPYVTDTVGWDNAVGLIDLPYEAF